MMTKLSFTQVLQVSTSEDADSVVFCSGMCSVCVCLYMCVSVCVCMCVCVCARIRIIQQTQPSDDYQLYTIAFQ